MSTPRVTLRGPYRAARAPSSWGLASALLALAVSVSMAIWAIAKVW